MADTAVSADGFFGLVAELLTPSMAVLGYHRIGGSVNDQPSSRGALTRVGAIAHERESAERASLIVYDFGYEAASLEVRRLVDPRDPDSADELWLSYEPAAKQLDFRAWEPIARGRVDWDPWCDTGPCSAAEVRRRLAAMGTAVADFVRTRGSRPPRS